jgi:hypothetical protein
MNERKRYLQKRLRRDAAKVCVFVCLEMRRCGAAQNNTEMIFIADLICMP